jgi:small subunit ribosomal protein S2
MKELLEAGVHFGHQVRRWNPKMKEFIFGERNGIYIIDLQKTQRMFKEAIKFVTDLMGQHSARTLLFVGTKRQAQDAIRDEAQRCNQFYINQRWLGGLLTNFQTIQKSIKRLKEIESMQADGRIEQFAKKERLQIERERLALEKNLSGIKDLKRLPGYHFRHRHQQGRDCRQGGEPTGHSGGRRRRYELRSRWSELRHSGQR